jgi:hypothetical protein
MGMTWNFNPGALEASISQTGDRAVKGMSERMQRVALKVRDLARAYAPRKTGALEDAIDYEKLRDGANRNSFVVYVDTSHPSGDHLVGDYAFIMEEELHPFGRKAPGGRYYNLGPGSRAKGGAVGGKFLERAVAEGIAGLGAGLLDDVRRAVRGSSLINTVLRPTPIGGADE